MIDAPDPIRYLCFAKFLEHVAPSAMKTGTPYGFFATGWEIAVAYILHHERDYGHEWTQAMGFDLGRCDDCGATES